MFLNSFAETAAPLELASSDEFQSLLASAADLGIPHARDTAYSSHNIVLRRLRFHYLEWGSPDAPPIVLLHGGHQSAHSWDLVSLYLAQRYRVLALDQRGHGDSECRATSSIPTVRCRSMRRRSSRRSAYSVPS